MREDLQKAIILDVDGVMLNWLDGFIQWMDEENGNVSPVGWEKVSSWGLSQVLPHYTAEEIWDSIEAFNRSLHFGNLQVMPGALRGVRNVAKLAKSNGYKISVITSAGEGISLLKARVDNLYRVFGDVFDDVFVVPLGGSKRHFLEMYGPGSIFLDDLEKNLHVADGLHFKTILFNRKYNSGPESGFTSVSDWHEFYEVVFDEIYKGVAA